MIRSEEPADLNAIRQVHIQAFGGPGEAQLVDMLRASGNAVISLVAIHQGKIAGHILFSPIDFDPPQPAVATLGLAPLGVLPSLQNQGIGSQLIIAGLDGCRQAECQAVIVLGQPSFYARFGFQPASKLGLENEYGAQDAFMALELIPGALNQISGLAKYGPEFSQSGV